MKDYTDDISLDEVKDFVAEAQKRREDFLNISERSWNEIEKRNKKGRLYGGNDLERNRRWTRFPLWWSCWKIRQPIVFARLPIPVIKDSQGDDPFGRTACVVGERLIRGILKTRDPFSEFQASVDDLLVTNFGQGRIYYHSEMCVEPERVRLMEVQQPEPEPIMDEQGQPIPAEPLPPIYVNPDGQPVAEPLFDEYGAYILSGQKVEIESEEVYFKSVYYAGMLVDPSAKRWGDVTRVVFVWEYSYREFKDRFGQEGCDALDIKSLIEHKEGKPITVYEYHDKMMRQVRWFAETSFTFFQPREMVRAPDMSGAVELEAPVDERGLDHSDIYSLSSFFPCPEPMIINQSSRNFWPTSEYFQVADIINDIHQIVDRMVLLTKAIRVRFLFDESIPQLKSLISEVGEGGGIGIPNLEAALMNGNADLTKLVAYLPVDQMITGLSQMYIAFQQRLDMFYQITGISDLIRGQTNPDSDKTYGERQMEGRFALNRIEPPQRKVQEFIKDSYQIMLEMALKNFSDKSIDDYVVPQTLDPEDRQRYTIALDLLKSNKRRRFRIDFETDSTIAINQDYRKKNAIEIAEALTQAIESVATVAQTQPELAGTELKVLKHMIGEFADGKLFIDEIQDSIQQIIEKVSQPQPPQPNPDEIRAQVEMAKLQLEREKATAGIQLEQLKMQAQQAIEMAKIEKDTTLKNIEAQLTQYKVMGDQQIEQLKVQMQTEESRAELEKEYQKISADILTAQQEMELKRQELLVELRKIADKKEVDQLSLMIDERVRGFENQLEAARVELEKTTAMLDMKERFITEQRLQAEHQLDKNNRRLESVEKVLDLALKKKELDAPIEVPKASEPEESKPKKPKKTRSKVVRDKNDNIVEILNEEIE